MKTVDLQDLLKIYAGSASVKALAKNIEKSPGATIAVGGLVASSAPVVLAALAGRARAFLIIMPDADAAGYFYHDLTQLLGTERVLYFPSSYRRSVKYAQKDAANEILRTAVLTAPLNPPLRGETASASSPSPKGESRGGAGLFIVSHPEAVAELVVSKKQLVDCTISLAVGQSVSTQTIIRRLRELKFSMVDYVYEPGQFALRGSILDVYSFNNELPFRIDFFGDEIDTIRTFETESQLSKEKLKSVDIVPEMGSVEERVSLLSFLPKETVIVARDFDYIADVIQNVYDEGFAKQAVQERLEEAHGEMERDEIMRQLRSEAALTDGATFRKEIKNHTKIALTPSLTLTPSLSLKGEGACNDSSSAGSNDKAPSPFRERVGERAVVMAALRVNISPQPLFHKNFDMLQETLNNYRSKGYRIFILADSQKQHERLNAIFESNASANEAKKNPLNPLNPCAKEKTPCAFTPIQNTLHEGFADDDLKICLFTDHQIFDRFHKYNLKSDRARGGKVALTLKEIQQFEVGDYIVHVDHGIGKFMGLVRMPQGNGYREMIKIQYQQGGAIYVSIHSLYKVSKYKAQDAGEAPRLSTLGTGQWERLKEKTKKKLKDIARDLIKLYAERSKKKGFAYSPDTFMQHELEAGFLYEDTPDQLKATNDVKQDMERQRPMDRLVCGDVGFGKTEVAVRAAFKAACDSKQVAVLVPTTVLAYQHYQTFSGRLKDLPVRVEYLSRARSAKQTTAILKDLEEGKIDILIGTHKLIGKNVKFKDLGLLIIDEEQKFGVSAKEKLRQMKINVDTLTMSATPIPRTLQFSLVGARDLSIIQTPPPNRYPIQTEIHTFGVEIISDAINFEMSRNGQVYFVNNRINDLNHIKEIINRYVPDARVAVGHGQMKPEELEHIIMDFQNHDYDVLLSTTIVENGIDIPNANTIIINGAQNFGLSDLHQMRGRVGRGNRKAFCYLLAPPLSALKADARRRLEALENFSGLGAGINIAMQDLDIRGAGNLLGAEQSGFIADLGYETYRKILNQAVAELKNEEFGELFIEEAKAKDGSAEDFVDDCVIDSDLEMYFPETYVPNDSERMLLYRELDNLKDDDELERYRARLIDRFGNPPTEAEELMQVVALRRVGRRLGCEKINLTQGRAVMYFPSGHNIGYYQSSAFDRVLNFIAANPKKCNIREQNGKRSLVISGITTVGQAVATLQRM